MAKLAETAEIELKIRLALENVAVASQKNCEKKPLKLRK